MGNDLALPHLVAFLLEHGARHVALVDTHFVGDVDDFDPARKEGAGHHVSGLDPGPLLDHHLPGDRQDAPPPEQLVFPSP